MSRNSGRTNRKAVGGLAGLGSAAAVVGAGIAAMAAGSVPTAAPQPDHSDVQTATLAQATTGGTGTVDRSAGFVTPPTPLPPTPSLSGSPAPKNTPVIPGVTQDTTSSTNNPGGNSFPFLPLTSQAGIAPTSSGLALNPSTSNNDPLGFGNVGVAPAGRITVNTDGTTTVNPGGVFAISTPLGGGSSTFGFPVTIDNNGNVKFTAWDNFINGLVNLPDLKNTTNTTGFASDQPANPNFDTNAPFGGTPTGDPLSKQAFDSLANAVQANDAAGAASAFNALFGQGGQVDTLLGNTQVTAPVPLSNFNPFDLTGGLNPAASAANMGSQSFVNPATTSDVPPNQFAIGQPPFQPGAANLGQGSIDQSFSGLPDSGVLGGSPAPALPSFQQIMQQTGATDAGQAGGSGTRGLSVAPDGTPTGVSSAATTATNTGSDGTGTGDPVVPAPVATTPVTSQVSGPDLPGTVPETPVTLPAPAGAGSSDLSNFGAQPSGTLYPSDASGGFYDS